MSYSMKKEKVGVRSSNDTHIIPVEDEHPERETKYEVFSATETTVSLRDCAVNSFYNNRTKKNSQQSSGLLRNAFHALRQMRTQTSHIGCQVVLKEANEVKSEYLQMQNRMQQRKQIRSEEESSCTSDADVTKASKRRRFSCEVDDSIPPVSSSDETPENTNSNEDVSEEEKVAMLKRATRMKRLSSLFRNLEAAQNEILENLHELVQNEVAL